MGITDDIPELPNSEDIDLDIDLEDFSDFIEEGSNFEEDFSEDSLFENISEDNKNDESDYEDEEKDSLEELIENDSKLTTSSSSDEFLSSSDFDNLDLNIDDIFVDSEEDLQGADEEFILDEMDLIDSEEDTSHPVQKKVTKPDVSNNMTLQEFTNNAPAWVKEMISKKDSQISHAFLLDFNVKDYAYRRYTLNELLVSLNILGSYDIVVKYDLANGVSFPTSNSEVHKERFLEATGLKDKMDNLKNDELYQALNDTPEEEYEEPVIPDTPLDLFLLLAPLFMEPSRYNNDGRIFLYIDSIEMILPDAPIAQMSMTDRKLMMLIEAITSTSQADVYNNLLVMVTDNGQELHNDLKHSSNRIEKITLPLPSKEERLKFIEEELIKAGEMESLFKEEITPQGLGNLSAGLSKIQIEDIALRALAEETCITEKLVKERKSDIIRTEYEDVIEIIDSVIGFGDIGGMETIKQYFKEEVINPIKKGEEEYWRVPLGIMFLGPAGTGKTLLAQAVAKESQMNCVNLNISKILNKYVGDSEKNFEKALQCIQSMEPTIVIVEEIDNVFAGRGTDSSGVGGRLFKRFLEFMSDTSRRGKVIVISTSNYPSRMDAALKRPGRFDKKIPFLVPEAEDRLDIMGVLAKRKGFELEITSVKSIKSAPAPEQRNALMILKKTEGMTGAELETIIQKAITYAYKESRKIVTMKDVFQACQVVIPSTSAIKEMTKEALIECNDLEFIPKKYREYATKLKEQLIEKIPTTEPGSLNG